MSSITSSTSPAPSSSSCSTANFSVFPTSDVACAVGSINGIPSNTSSVFSSCCKSAPVEQFNGNCGYYCLAIQQSVADLQACFMNGGVLPGTIFCNSNNTATATAKPSSSSKPTASGSKGASSGTSSPGASQSKGAAHVLLAPQGVNKAGLAVVGTIVISALVGALL